MSSDRFCRVPAQVLGNPALRRLELQVLLAICLHVNRTTGETWVGQSRIASLTGFSPSKVSRAIRTLEAEGVLTKYRTRFKDGRLGMLSYHVRYLEPPVVRGGQVEGHDGKDRSQLHDHAGQDQVPTVDKTSCPPRAEPHDLLGQHNSPFDNSQALKAPLEAAYNFAGAESATPLRLVFDANDMRSGLTPREALLREVLTWYQGIGKGDDWAESEIATAAQLALEDLNDGDASKALHAIQRDGKGHWQKLIRANVTEAALLIESAKARKASKALQQWVREPVADLKQADGEALNIFGDY